MIESYILEFQSVLLAIIAATLVSRIAWPRVVSATVAKYTVVILGSAVILLAVLDIVGRHMGVLR